MSVVCLPTGNMLVVKWWTKFCGGLTSANCLESNSQDLLDEKKREACLQRKFVVKMYWLEEQDFLTAEVGHLLVRLIRLDSRGGDGSQ